MITDYYTPVKARGSKVVHATSREGGALRCGRRIKSAIITHLPLNCPRCMARLIKSSEKAKSNL